MFEVVFRAFFLLVAFCCAALSAMNLAEGRTTLDWTGNHLVDTVLLWSGGLVFTLGLGGSIGGWTFITALFASLGIAITVAFTNPNWESVTFLFIVLTATVLSLMGKAWKTKGADFTEKDKKRTPKNKSDKSILGTTAKTGVAAVAAKKLLHESTKPKPPIVKYRGKGTYLGCKHLTGNKWELSFQDEYSRKVRKTTVNKGNRNGMATTSHRFDLEW